MLDAIGAVPLGVERRERSREIRTPKTVLPPAGKVPREACKVFRLVGKSGCQRGNFIHCRGDDLCGAVVTLESNASIGLLDRAQGVDDSLESHPR